MYQARLHPEQYSNTFTDEQVARLHKALMYVCDTAVELLADSDQFPKDWLMKHRWGKGKKDGNKLPTGEKITFLKVGGRTSAIVPSLQKKTAAVAGDLSESADGEVVEEAEHAEKVKPKRGGKRKVAMVKKEDEEDEEETTEETKPAKPKRARKKAEAVEESGEEEEEEEPASKKQTKASNRVSKKAKAESKEELKEESTGRRRSGRLSK